MSPVAVEVIGYVASFLVVSSLAMTSVLKLRTLSLLGSTAYVIYGLLLSAWPIVVANGIIALLNAWNIHRELTSHKDLGVSPIDIDAPYLTDFLEACRGDIDKFQPGVTPEASDRAWLFLRGGLPVGALIGRVDRNEFRVKLDYVRPSFRDYKLGGWLFGEGFKQLGLSGVTRIVANPGTASHRRYLASFAFTRDGESMSREVG
ncbi:MAG: hypothetical protein OZ921_06905 [Sorangiineae bacterium]|nr:hypothetical protein [Polyangiaceae bacterium]MEB2322225.1 hypothetical protein [Sorangiineae bacterium]